MVLTKSQRIVTKLNFFVCLVDGFKWDVFISYHNETEDLVIEQVKEPLESAQYKVCWHHDDFIVGKPITDNINEAVDNSRKVVVILSPSFTDSEHCMMELDRTLNRLLTTRTRCIVPILTDTECEVPLELRSKVTYWPIIEGVTDIYQQLIETIGESKKTLQNYNSVIYKKDM